VKSSSISRKQGIKGLLPLSPAPQIPAEAPALRSGQFRLTIPNTYLTISTPASPRSDCCSPSSRMPFGFPAESAFTFTEIPTRVLRRYLLSLQLATHTGGWLRVVRPRRVRKRRIGNYWDLVLRIFKSKLRMPIREGGLIVRRDKALARALDSAFENQNKQQSSCFECSRQPDNAVLSDGS